MRAVRPLIAVAVGTSLVIGFSAQAGVKVKPVCNLVTDAAGDANQLPSQDLSPVPATTPAGGPSSGPLDILSGDLAGDKKQLTGVIRVKKLSTTDPTFSPTGMAWDFGFVVEGQKLDLLANTDPTGKVTFAASYFDKTTMGGSLYGSGSVTGVLDTVKNEVRITAPYDLFSAQATIKPGTVITGLTILTATEIAIPEATGKLGGGNLLTDGIGIDDASSTMTYKAGAPSCVKPGA